MTTRRLRWLVLGYSLALAAYLALDGTAAQLAVAVTLRVLQPVGVLLAVRRFRPRAAEVWRLLAAALLAGGVGDTVVDLTAWVHLPGVAIVAGELAQFGCYVVLLAAAALLVRRRSPAANADLMLDSAAGVSAVGVVLWQVLGTDALPTRMTDPTARPMAVLLVLTVLAIVSISVRQAVRSERAGTTMLLLVVAGCTALAGNVAQLVSRRGAFTGGGVVGACWLAAAGLVTLAALHPSMAELGEPAPRGPAQLRLRVAFLGMSLAVIPGVLVVEGLRHQPVAELPLGGGAAVVLGLVATRVVRAVHAREFAVLERERGELRLRAMVEHSLDGIAVLAPDGVVKFLVGAESVVPPSVQPGTNIYDRLDEKAAVYLRALVADVLAEPDRLQRGEIRLRGADPERWMEILLGNRIGDATVDGILVNFRDVTERRAAEEELEHRAMHDALTGLPNRALLLDRLAHALVNGRRTGRGLAVLFCDVDRFKIINDSRGHAAGDELLVAVGNRLASRLRASDTLARFGGDEFVVLCENVAGDVPPLQLLEAVLAAFAEPFVLPSGTVTVTTSIGVTVAEPDDPRSPDALLRDADAAMYRAKARGRNRWEVFDPGLRAGVVARLDTELELRDALDRDEIEPFYQPVVELATRRLAGFEALARWRHPRRGLLVPGDFLTVAEASGLVVPLCDRMLAAACRQVAEWRRTAYGEELTVSVNVAMTQLSRPDAAQRVLDIIAEAGLPPNALTLEITESTMTEHDGPGARALQTLRAVGVRLALDDFGAGHSSLSYLRDLDFDVLKIDRSFVGRLERSTEDRAVTTAIVELARALRLDVVGEGVETDVQLRALAEMGCRYGQGYRLGPPVPAAAVDLAEWVVRQHRVAGVSE